MCGFVSADSARRRPFPDADLLVWPRVRSDQQIYTLKRDVNFQSASYLDGNISVQFVCVVLISEGRFHLCIHLFFTEKDLAMLWALYKYYKTN